MRERLMIAVLAAGGSRRLGQPKQLVRLHGETLIHRQCRISLESQLGDVLVVLGCQADACEREISDLPVNIVRNKRWAAGLASSIRLAITTAATKHFDGLLLVHGDQFALTATDLQQLAIAWTNAPSRPHRSVSRDYAGPPVILPSVLFGQAHLLEGDEGARRLLVDGGVGPIDFEMPNAVHDLDEPEQLARLDDRT